jgi:hypothetical protein
MFASSWIKPDEEINQSVPADLPVVLNTSTSISEPAKGSSFLKTIRDAAKEKLSPSDAQKISAPHISMRQDELRAKISGLNLSNLSQFSSQFSNDNKGSHVVPTLESETVRADIVEGNGTQSQETVIQKTETTLIAFKDISDEMLKELGVSGVVELTKVGELESKITNLKNELSNQAKSVESAVAEIDRILTPYNEIVKQFKIISGINSEESKITYENVGLAISDIDGEVAKLNIKKEETPGQMESKSAELKAELDALVLELREMQKKAVSPEVIREFLKAVSILLKIAKITAVTEEIQNITSKMNRNAVGEFLKPKNLNAMGLIKVLASKKPTPEVLIDNAVNDNSIITEKAAA